LYRPLSCLGATFAFPCMLDYMGSGKEKGLEASARVGDVVVGGKINSQRHLPKQTPAINVCLKRY